MAIRNGSTRLWKPGVGTPIDRSHPAARGLQACWLCNENGGRMLYDSMGSYHFVLTGGVARVAEPLGPGIKFDGTSGQGLAAGHPLASAQAYTVLLRLRQKDALASPFGPYLGSEQGHMTGLYIAQDINTTLQFWATSSKMTIPVTNDVWGHYALQWSNATGIQRSYVNGLAFGDNVNVFGTLPAYTNTYLGLASAATGSYLMDASVSSISVYNRFLSAVEIAADYASPYAMFAPPQPRRFYSLPASGGSAASGGLSLGGGRLSIGV
jgi:hypothetical protein